MSKGVYPKTQAPAHRRLLPPSRMAVGGDGAGQNRWEALGGADVPRVLCLPACGGHGFVQPALQASLIRRRGVTVDQGSEPVANN